MIKEKSKHELYYNFLEAKEKNPLIDNIKDDLDIHIVNQTLSKLSKLLANRLVPFNTGKYPNSKQILAFYLDIVSIGATINIMLASVLADGVTIIENAARVAFIKEGSVAYGSTPASAQALKGEVSKWIWEPNYDVHTAAGVSNALNVYGTTVGQTGGPKLAYKGVKAPIAAANNIPLNSTNTSYFADVTTVGSVATGIPSSAYLNSFDVAEGVTKVRIYMWIEGQDVDCEDRASGGSLTYNLQFSINPNAG